MRFGLPQLILRGAWHYRRIHAGVLVGAAVGATVLAGAFFVGDSVRSTLLELALLRVGKAEYALVGGDRFFRAALSEEIEARTGGKVAAAILTRGSAGRVDGTAAANDVQVLGVDASFWQLAPGGAPGMAGARDGEWVGVNRRLAAQLGVGAGDTVIVRIERPGYLPGDAPLSGERDRVVAVRVTVDAIVTDAQFGRFGLRAGQIPPYSLFLSIGRLQDTLDRAGRANLLLAATDRGADSRIDDISAALAEQWRARDSELEFRKAGDERTLELLTPRVFLDSSTVAVARAVAERGGIQPVLTYFVNSIDAANGDTPYSMVTAVDPWPGGPLADGMRDDEIAVNQWLSDDLGVSVGDRVNLRYSVAGDRRNLHESTREFVVARILPMEGVAIDPHWMPKFPGLSDAENCRDWEPGMPIDLARIREKDEEYWDEFGGAPKAFVTLSAGQEMWRNRWGAVTAVRMHGADLSMREIERKLDAALRPETIGLAFQPIRENAIAATRSPVDFSQLFLGFSVFLIGAGALLTGLLFAFAVEHRSEEAGLLLAVGIKRRTVTRMFVSEGGVIAVVGSVVGVAAAFFYSRVILWALANVWRGAVGEVSLSFDPTWRSAALAIVLNVAVAVFAMAAAGRSILTRSAGELLTGAWREYGRSSGVSKGRLGAILTAVFVLFAGVLSILGFGESGGRATGLFFVAGSLLLLGGGSFFFDRMRRILVAEDAASELRAFSSRNVCYRPWRSLAVALAIGSGVFMVIAVSSFRHPGNARELERSPGTGGFSHLGETAIPVYENLASADGRDALAIPEDLFSGARIVPVRVRAGDDASCLNLNRAIHPRLLGVSPSEMDAQSAFRFTKSRYDGVEGDSERWSMLEAELSDGSVPAIGDEATVRWALGKSVGDVINYTDERGSEFTVRIVGSVSGSILQGSIIVSEKRLLEKYPSHGGYRLFFIDAPRDRGEAFATAMTRIFADQGLSLVPAQRRLADLQAVENTYISIFQVLGALGILLGTAGIGIVVVRNSMERRGEFALLLAIGFPRALLLRILRMEHRTPLWWGLAVGTLSAVLAVLPAIIGRYSGFPVLGMSLLVLAMALAGLGGIWLGVSAALRFAGCEDLREE